MGAAQNSRPRRQRKRRRRRRWRRRSEEEDAAAAAGLTAVVGMRFVLYEDHGSVVAIVERSGRVIVVYDDCEP